MLLLLLLLADKASVSCGVDAEGQDNASHRSEEEEETGEEGQEKEEEEMEEEEEKESGAGATKIKNSARYRCSVQDWDRTGLCIALY